MKRYILSLLGMIVVVGASAQSGFRSRYVYLNDGTEITINAADCDSIVEIGTLGFKVYYKNSTESVDYLYSQVTIEEFGDVVYPDDDLDPIYNNVNRNRPLYWSSNSMVPNTYSNTAETWRLEYPHIELTDNDQVIVKSTTDYGITFSLEWNYTKKANRWTCYELHAGNNASNVSREDAFAVDPDIPEDYQSLLSDYSGSGFSRGHLCPSADRLCSREQNSQTFYLSNMQPQYQSHNSGIWLRVEEKVRDWDVASMRDTLYIVKAATIADVKINNSTSSGVYNTKCNNSLYVPKYFYCAVLAVKNGVYHAIGLWTEHSDDAQSTVDLSECAITIDELEARTGIDFFCNLPDDVEEEVESSLDLSIWGLD